MGPAAGPWVGGMAGATPRRRATADARRAAGGRVAWCVRSWVVVSQCAPAPADSTVSTAAAAQGWRGCRRAWSSACQGVHGPPDAASPRRWPSATGQATLARPADSHSLTAADPAGFTGSRSEPPTPPSSVGACASFACGPARVGRLMPPAPKRASTSPRKTAGRRARAITMRAAARPAGGSRDCQAAGRAGLSRPPRLARNSLVSKIRTRELSTFGRQTRPSLTHRHRVVRLTPSAL